jgi:hypothetical protein
LTTTKIGTRIETKIEIVAYSFIDPTGLVPVVNEVEWLRQQRPHSTVASTDARSAGGSQA